MKIAVEGCMHGDLDKVYDTIKYIENTRNIKIDLLLCCGDFQALDLKPNYGRAWANMGISYANQWPVQLFFLVWTVLPVILIPAGDIPFQGYPCLLLSRVGISRSWFIPF
ncbi:hypothetical protein GOBAR_AA30533 [Gossypium barbadense]|uniref:Calcineurin-like phosphoesterase domain-containing protein n=1 Tax=Gossypium barbadense TaxID=3634 RepID=A0A2P5WGF0_GOSBA|nr:hypothetical protein GOBAR_AA30533 [Gossypium barbadense]